MDADKGEQRGLPTIMSFLREVGAEWTRRILPERKTVVVDEGLREQLPTVISFYCGAPYYYEAAERLVADCKALGLDYDIVELKMAPGEDWSTICRKKIQFYKDMYAKHPNGVFWVDVDTRILGRPEFLRGGGYTLGAFLRSFKSLREFDREQFARMFHPGFLHFPPNEETRLFLEHLDRVERGSPANGTDDYFLQEAWATFDRNPSVHVFSPDAISFVGKAHKPGAVFQFGDSGNVKSFAGKVEQHSAGVFEVGRQKRLLSKYAADAIKRGRRGDAITFLRTLVGLDRTDVTNLLRLANLYLKEGDLDEAKRLLRGAQTAGVRSEKVVMMMADIALAQSDLKLLRFHVNTLSKSTDAAVKAFARSRRFRLEVEERAQKMGLAPEDRPALWWMEQPYPGNFGDILNPYLVEKLSGLPPRHVEKGEGFLAIGSVIKFAKSGTKVWGTGTPRMTDKLAPDAVYTAVRGPFTRALVLESGGTAPELYGDAAMLLPLIYPRKTPPQKGRVGLIRHYAHAERSARLKEVYEIDIRRCGYGEIEQFLDQVLSCEYIMSTSLHGLIVAHAYGIPTKWCAYLDEPDKIPGGDLKFRDHYAAFDIHTEGPLDLSKVSLISAKLAVHCTEVVRKPLDAVGLLDAAPFPVLPEFRRAALTMGLEAHDEAVAV